MTTAEAIRQPRGAFAALTSRGYRIYLAGRAWPTPARGCRASPRTGSIFDLTHSSTAVGVTMALQFLPMLLLGLHAGAVADRLPKRRILLTTQTLNAVATGALAAITIAGAVRPADVYAFALAERADLRVRRAGQAGVRGRGGAARTGCAPRSR